MHPLVGELSSDEIPLVCALFHAVFGVTTTPAQWAWKYAQGPRLGSVNIVARDAHGALVGHAGASVFAGGTSGQPLAMAQVCDVMVAKSARGGVESSTVYHRLIEALQRALRERFSSPYAYGFAGVRPFKLGHRMGFYREVHLCRPGYLADMSHHAPPRWWSVQPMPWNHTRLDQLWSAWAAGNNNSPKVARSGAYLHWRYATHPVHSYQLWVVKRLWQDKGWFITRTLPNGEVCVVDALLPAHAHAAILTHALAQAMERAGADRTPLFAWYLQTPASVHVEPVVGSEVKVSHWHTALANPVFHPGDTDVF